MRSGTHFEVELESDDEGVARAIVRMNAEQEVLTFANEHLQPHAMLVVACLGHGVDFGNLYIKMDAQGICTLIAHEHREFCVEGVSLRPALSALAHWLPMQERTPELAWQGD